MDLNEHGGAILFADRASPQDPGATFVSFIAKGISKFYEHTTIALFDRTFVFGSQDTDTSIDFYRNTYGFV